MESAPAYPVSEIAHWVHRLLVTADYGWSRDGTALAKFLGFQHQWRMRNFLWGDWKMPVKLQLYASAKLRMILDGEVTIERRLRQGRGFAVVESMIVHCDHPRPIHERGPVNVLVTVTRDGVKVRVRTPIGHGRPASGAMPSFSDIWQGLDRAHFKRF